MAETFIITVLSFALVLAVIASLLVWVIMPAIKEDEEETEKSKVKELTLSDYIDDINKINKSAFEFDQDQQKEIDTNTDTIAEIQEDLETVAGLATVSLLADDGVSTSNEASAHLENGVWTISRGEFTFKATPTEVCVDGDCSAWTSSGEAAGGAGGAGAADPAGSS